LFELNYFLEEMFNGLDLSKKILCQSNTDQLLNYQVKTNIVQLLNVLKNYHFETYQHSVNVACLSFLISQEMGIARKEIIRFTIGGLLHDIGKIKIEPYLLSKNSELTPAEWTEMKKHPQLGAYILSSFSWANKIIPIVLYHHERIDGNGYYRLKGTNISLSSRIICLADAFEAMMSARAYKKSFTLSQCFEEIQKNSGSQFDSDLVKVLIRIISKPQFYMKNII